MASNSRRISFSLGQAMSQKQPFARFFGPLGGDLLQKRNGIRQHACQQYHRVMPFGQIHNRQHIGYIAQVHDLPRRQVALDAGRIKSQI